MASQLARVRFDKRLRPDQTEALNARLGRLPQILAARERKRVTDAQIANLAAQQKTAKRRLALEEKQSRTALGVEVLKTGVKFATSDLGKETFSGLKGIFGGGEKAAQAVPTANVFSGGPPGAPGPIERGATKFGAVVPATSGGLGGFTGGLTLSNTLGSASLGFGAATLGTSLLGKKKKPLLGAALGAGAGLLSSFVGSGGFNLGAGLFGGLGGLAGGFI